ncbi:MAG: hypothetical protein IJI53_12820 [Clostridia bacterium]|nr:hypothetical protein [Clostridia bacterium]
MLTAFLQFSKGDRTANLQFRLFSQVGTVFVIFYLRCRRQSEIKSDWEGTIPIKKRKRRWADTGKRTEWRTYIAGNEFAFVYGYRTEGAGGST